MFIDIARHVDSDFLKVLIKSSKFDPDVTVICYFWQQTDLSEAVCAGHIECVKLLLNAGASPHLGDEQGSCPTLRGNAQ